MNCPVVVGVTETEVVPPLELEPPPEEPPLTEYPEPKAPPLIALATPAETVAFPPLGVVTVDLPEEDPVVE